MACAAGSGESASRDAPRDHPAPATAIEASLSASGPSIDICASNFSSAVPDPVWPEVSMPMVQPGGRVGRRLPSLLPSSAGSRRAPLHCPAILSSIDDDTFTFPIWASFCCRRLPTGVRTTACIEMPSTAVAGGSSSNDCFSAASTVDNSDWSTTPVAPSMRTESRGDTQHRTTTRRKPRLIDGSLSVSLRRSGSHVECSSASPSPSSETEASLTLAEPSHCCLTLKVATSCAGTARSFEKVNVSAIRKQAIQQPEAAPASQPAPPPQQAPKSHAHRSRRRGRQFWCRQKRT